jgi:cytochrome c2
MGAEVRAGPAGHSWVRSHDEAVPTLWHLCGVALVVLVPTLVRLQLPFWALQDRLLPQVPALAAGYLGTALVVASQRRSRGGLSLLFALVLGPVVFGAAFLLLLYLPGFDYSRLVILAGASLGTVVAVAPYYLPLKARRWGLLLLVPAAVAALGWSRLATPGSGQLAAVERTAGFAGTALHNLTLESYAGLVAPSDAFGGAIVAYGDAFIATNGVGDFAWIRPSGEAFSSEPMELPRVLDREAFLAATSPGFEALHFRIMDLLVDSTATPHRLLASHYFWEPIERCVAMRISSIPIPEPRSASSAEWEPIFTTQPCVPVEEAVVSEGLTNHSGGRMAWGRDQVLLYSVGDLSVVGPDGRARFPQESDNDYGKILAIDPEGRASPYSLGMRNPEGLLVARDGTIWETEHGPTGGDELNLIVAGGNYGWPRVSYGAEVGARSRGISGATMDHGGYEEPAFSWLPSIGVSNLIEVGGAEFPEWEGDLLVASLNGQSLFRIRVREGRVAYTERIQLGGRLRDLAQDSRGRILVWRDDATLVVIANAGADRTGEAVFSSCRTCHESVDGQPALGPDLRNLYGREAGSLPTFQYSEALSSQDLRWSPETLDLFLANPAGYIPGTRMDVPAIPEEDRAAVTDYLWVYQ